MMTFGDLTDEVQQNRKYAKWKAAYIHKCLKNGEQPQPGPMAEDEQDDEENDLNNLMKTNPQPPAGPQMGFNLPPPSDDPAPSSSNVPFEITSPEQLPSPPKEPEKPPGGFKPYVPPPGQEQPPPPAGSVQLSTEQMTKAQKYCKWAGSALNYDDVPTAVTNLQKALRLLQTGQDG